MARPISPMCAAALSLLVPGLGQVAAGASRRGLAILAPLLLGLAALVGAFLGDPVRSVAALLRSEVLLAVIAGSAVFLVYHVVAIVDAYRVGRRRAGTSADADGGAVRSRRSRALLAAIVAIAIGVDGTLGLAAVRVNEAADSIFLGGGLIPEPGPTPTPPSSPTPGPSSGPTPSPTPGRTPGPFPTPVPVWAQDGRLNLLLIGADRGPGRWSLRTDTMILLSVDVETNRAALFGFPRNLRNVPLPAESAGAFRSGRFPDLLNALYVHAGQHPEDFPGGDGRGFRALSGAIQELSGVRLDGFAGVDLNGFVRLVDAIGGLWIDVPWAIFDSHYPLENGRGSIVLRIRKGCQVLDGRYALAYTRTRHESGNDYNRMRRQQQLLLALRRQLDPLAMLPRFPELVDIAQDSLWTTLTPDDISDLAHLAAKVDTSNVETVYFWPPEYPEFLDDEAIEAIRTRVRTIFDAPAAPDPSASPSPSPSPSGPPAACPPG